MDLDNTLYDYDFCHQQSMDILRYYMKREYSLDERVFNEVFTRARKKVKGRLSDTASSHNRLLYMQSFLEELGCFSISAALRCYEIYWGSMLEKMTPFDYVYPLLERLEEKGIKMAVLTDLTAHIQYRKVMRLGIDKFISALVTSEEVGKEKPDLLGFQETIRKLDIHPWEALMIGDSLSKDIKGAEKAGIYTLLFSKEWEGQMEKMCMELIYGEEDKK